MSGIKKVFSCDQNLLVVDKDNKVWIMGTNLFRRTGFGKLDEAIYSPIYTTITLDSDEEIAKFYVEDDLVAFYTTKKRIFISKHQNPENDSNTNNASLESRIASDSRASTPEVAIRYAEQSEEESNHEDTSFNERHSYSDYSENDQDLDEISNDDGSDIDSDDDVIIHTPIRLSGIARLNGGEYENIPIHNGPVNNHELTNSKYFNILKTHPNPIHKDTGFDLLDVKADDVIFVGNIILFTIGNELFVYEYKLNEYERIMEKDLKLSIIPIKTQKYTYYKIVFPFDYDHIVLKRDFAYIYSNGYNHIITACTDILWLYFKSDFVPDVNKIYYNKIYHSVYVQKDDVVYKLYHPTHQLKIYIDQNIKRIIFDDTTLASTNLIAIKNDGVYYDEEIMKKEFDYNERFENYITHNEYYTNKIIIYSRETPEKYSVDGENLYFNVNGVTFYKLTDKGLVYYDITNTLYLVSNEKLFEDQYGTVEIEKINTPLYAFYIYMFTNIPASINEIFVENSLVVIRSGDDYYYHTLYHGTYEKEFYVNKFTQIILENSVDSGAMVCQNHVLRQRKNFETFVDLSIALSSNKLNKFLSIMEMIDKYVGFNIRFIRESSEVSFGDGPKIEFMDSALTEFQDKYLIRNNNLTQFNLETIKNCSDDELFCIGKMLHAVICHSGSNLSIHLPLNLLYHINNKKKFTLEEFEYFAKIEDPEMFATTKNYKDNPKGFAELESNFDSYENYIKNICGYKENNAVIDYISGKISSGIHYYNVIKNLAMMNYPTLDYYMSGDYTIDRNLFIRNIKIEHYNSREKTDTYRQIIVDIIKELPESKLTALIKNWSGSTVVKPSGKYRVSIIKKDDNPIKSDIYFGACNKDLIILEGILKNEETRHLVVEFLTSPMSTMVD